MKAVCIDANLITVLQEGKEYFVFPNGPSSFFVSNFNSVRSHMGAFQRSRFKLNYMNEKLDKSNGPLIENNKYQGNSNDSAAKVNVLEQMDIFDFLSEDHENVPPIGIEIIIPHDVISPLECTKGVKTKEFRIVQKRWKNYVDALNEQEGGSWLEAREKLIRHRDNKEPLLVAWDPQKTEK
ncbi:MAG TPA: hypothetical protein DEO65_04540 [Bacillus bacterium]|nr:hypothetical protein [Bacillus sp. (in: firmicutes)]